MVLDDDRVEAARPQPELRRRVRVRHPAIGVAARVDLALLRQQVEHRARVLKPAEGLAPLEGQFIGRAAQVVDEDHEVIGVDERVLWRLLEHETGMRDHVLVERRAACNQHAHRDIRPAARPPELLPRARNRAGVAREDRRPQRADVHAKLQRVRRHDALHGPLAQPALDLPPLQRQVAAPVATHPRRGDAHHLDLVAQVAEQHLGRQPCPRKHDGLRARLQKPPGDAARLQRVAAPDAQLLVNGGRVVQDDVLLALRCAVVIHQHDRRLDQPFGKLLRVGNRCAGADEHRVAAMEPAHAPQPPQHVRHVATEHAPVRVQLVQHDELQVAKEVRPARVVRQDAHVKHVGVGDDDAALAPDLRTLAGGCVAVIDIERDLHPGVERAYQLAKRRRLILRERLRREEVQRRRARVVQYVLDGGQVIGQRLAGRCAGHQHDVLPGKHRLDGLRLMHVQRRHAAPAHKVHQPRVEPRREVGVARRPRRDALPRSDVVHKARAEPQFVQQLLQVHAASVSLEQMFAN